MVQHLRFHHVLNIYIYRRDHLVHRGLSLWKQSKLTHRQTYWHVSRSMRTKMPLHIGSPNEDSNQPLYQSDQSLHSLQVETSHQWLSKMRQVNI